MKEFLNGHLVEISAFFGVYAFVVNFAVQLARI